MTSEADQPELLYPSSYLNPLSVHSHLLSNYRLRSQTPNNFDSTTQKQIKMSYITNNLFDIFGMPAHIAEGLYPKIHSFSPEEKIIISMNNAL